MRLLPDDPVEYLRQLGEAGHGPHDVAGAALMLSALDNPGRELGAYIDHLAELAEQARLDSRDVADAEIGAHALAALLAGKYGYDGDRLSYDDPKNADLISVIDRRRGLPVGLGILYLHAARAAGFQAAGLHSPGHFLLRVEIGRTQALIDPFNGGAVVDQECLGVLPAIRGIRKDRNESTQPVDDIEILLRLENNPKLRATETGDLPRALTLAKLMLLIAPKRPELWIELAQLHEQEGELGAARNAYNACLTLALPGAPLHNEAALGLEDLRRRLN
jgi:regulator of sirC expression with transglutaminase-like and TPR domain